MTLDDLKRIETKLDLVINNQNRIIQHFNIGKTPRRSNQQLDEVANAIVLDILNPKKGTKHGRHRINSRQKV